VEEGEKASVNTNRPWDQFMHAIATDSLYKVLNTLAEKEAAWQKVIMHHSGFVFTHVGPVLRSTLG